MPSHEDGLDGQPLNTLRPIGAQTPIPLEHAPVLSRRLISALTDATRAIAGAADGGWQGGSRRNRGQSDSAGANLVSIQRTGFSPPPDRHSPHDGMLPRMPDRPISQGGRPASATAQAMSGMSKRPVSAEIRYYHGRRRHPSRSFDATPWHQLGRPAWDASPPGVWRRSPPYPTPLYPSAQPSIIQSRTVTPQRRCEAGSPPAPSRVPTVHPRAPYHPPSSPRRKPTDIAIAPHLNEQVPSSLAPTTISTSSSVAPTHPHLHLSPTAISITTPTQP